MKCTSHLLTSPLPPSQFIYAMADLERRVFVGNLAYRTTCEDLREHFSQAGKVKKAEVYYDHSGRGPPTVVGRPVSKGCGVVEFEDEADAKYAAKELTETMLDGRAILVREDREQPPPTRKHEAIQDGGSRPGDWNCPKCSDMQFASRRECRSCGEPRPSTSNKPKGASFGANDWTCPACGDHQFARNLKCRQCGEPKPGVRRRNARSRTRTRTVSRRRSSSRSRRGHRRRARRSVKVKRERKEKKRGRSKKRREPKESTNKKDRKGKDAKKSRRDTDKRKEKKHKEKSSVSESYSYYSSYDETCDSSK